MPAESAGLLSRFGELRRQLGRASNEEEVRLAWVRALEGALGITFDAERGKRDLSYNNVVIEFKGPGKFHGRTTSPAFREAVRERLLPYIRRAARNERLHESDYIGLAIDDRHLAFAQVVDGEITHQNLLPVTARTFGMVVEACRACHRRAVTAGNLIEDFGHQSWRGLALMRVMADALADSEAQPDGKIRMLFEEWRTLYGQVADLSTEQLKGINGTLRFAHSRDSTEIPARLFVVHTFHSLLTKLLAAEILAAHGLASGRFFAADLVAVEDDAELLRRLRVDIEGGAFFEGAGIHGFVEEAIFSWYLDAAIENGDRSAIAAAIRDVLTGLSLYRTDRLDGSRDVLRDFYQDLVPELLRKTLGEFYTPDWLVEFTCDRAAVDDWVGTRALDPTCGSGAFLVEMIRRKRQAAARLEMSSAATVRMIVESVWGFDLNPLAVQVSRTNFLMAIADLLRDAPGQQVEIPVLLADAVYSPARLPDSEESVIEYQIGSQIADLKFLLPTELALDRARLDRVFLVMAELVEANADYAACETALAVRKVLRRQQLREWARPLRSTYDQVLRLHRRGGNGIWFRIVRNFFWSVTAGEFDLIVGNPPWVRWSRLPDAYRDRAKPTCEQYEIFSETPHHGGNELDVSGMITYTTADKWLRPGGTLAFVITQTHFQSPSSQGFRRFRINPVHRLNPLSVVDMKALRPFPEAANKTSVTLFRKTTRAPIYPVPYRLWTASKGKSRAVPTGLSMAEVMSRVAVRECEAHPVGGDGSPWAITARGRFADFSRIRGRSAWVQGRKGITTDLNGVYFVSVEASNESTGLIRIATRPDTGRTDLGASRTFQVEPTLLYPLLKGAADFETCYLKPGRGLFAFVPNDGITREACEEAEHRMNASCPNTKKYFRYYERRLRRRSTWSKRMLKAPFYSIYNVGAYTFAPYKVIWAEQSGAFKAAVAAAGAVPLSGERPYVPDHKIFFVAFEERAAACFLCGLLTSSLVREFVESHNISIQVGNIFKHLSLPVFDRTRQDHRRLARLVERAHQEDDASARAVLVDEVRCESDRIVS